MTDILITTNTHFEMEIDQLRDQGFYIKENKINDEVMVLIYPGPATKWTKDNLIYRSSIWRKSDKHPISLSYKKFFNWEERSDLIPEPYELKNAAIIEKIDGSTLAVSSYKGILIHRTRGTFDATNLDNGFEIEVLKKAYPKAFDNELVNSEKYTVIYEWVSPVNKIVLDYGETPDIYLTGIIKHEDYTMLTQNDLDNYAISFGVKRPIAYYFDDIQTMIETIKNLKGKEGICVYFDRFQNIKKVKGIEYLAKHAFKSNLTITNMIDMYVEYNLPSYAEFLAKIEQDFDYECAQMAMNTVSKILGAKKEIDKLVAHARLFVEPLKILPRKDAAEKILSSYGKTSRSGMLFKLLDGKELNKDDNKKLLYQMLKA